MGFVVTGDFSWRLKVFPSRQKRVLNAMGSIFSDHDRHAVTVAKVLAADSVEKVGNGHPGTAISLAPLAYLLYQKVMALDPGDPQWLGRDRFILSAGHSSLTQYVQLFLGGLGLELSDLQALRTWGSLTPGHPEYGHTPHVEITTGPLGQGIAAATGFAYAQRFERGLFDPEAPEGESPFDHYTYVIAGDGDLQEGVSSEAASLAGHQELGSLIVFMMPIRFRLKMMWTSLSPRMSPSDTSRTAGTSTPWTLVPAITTSKTLTPLWLPLRRLKPKPPSPH